MFLFSACDIKIGIHFDFKYIKAVKISAELLLNKQQLIWSDIVLRLLLLHTPPLKRTEQRITRTQIAFEHHSKPNTNKTTCTKNWLYKYDNHENKTLPMRANKYKAFKNIYHIL